QARVVLIGYSAGANIVWRMTQALHSDNTHLDLLVYLAGDTLRNCEGARPPNATKVINVRAWGLVFLAGGGIHGANIDQCESYDMGFVRHSCAPTHKPFLELMGKELSLVATSATRLPPVAESRALANAPAANYPQTSAASIRQANYAAPQPPP